MISVKGKLFEYFVWKLLLFCGFKPVNADGLLVFDGKPGIMIQGLGQAHNADVLMEPPFQTPFYFSTRLLIECKCYNDTIGLPVIRNALGLREDINRFDIVTEDILKNRTLSYTTKPTCYPMKRYAYQVAVASFSGFKSTAIPFAQTHRIPLISFAESLLFADVRNAILKIEDLALQDETYAKQVMDYLKENQYEKYLYGMKNEMGNTFRDFINKIGGLKERIVIGLLDNGAILFMLKQSDGAICQNHVQQYYDGCEIYWSQQTKSWELYDGQEYYSFELPKEIYQEWIGSLDEQRKAALEIKERYFSRIILFHNCDNDEGKIRTLYLSSQFIENAKKALD